MFCNYSACRRGVLPRAQGRLSEAERKAIKSGDIYVFNEEESQIKRYAIFMLLHQLIFVNTADRSNLTFVTALSLSDGLMENVGPQVAS